MVTVSVISVCADIEQRRAPPAQPSMLIVNFPPAPPSNVAQIGNLLYRRLVIGRTLHPPAAPCNYEASPLAHLFVTRP